MSNRFDPFLYFLMILGIGVTVYAIYKVNEEKEKEEKEKMPIIPPKPKTKEEDVERLWTNLEAWVRVIILPKFAKRISGVDELENGLEMMLENAIISAENFNEALRILDEIKKAVIEKLEEGKSFIDAVEDAIKKLKEKGVLL